MRKIVTLLLGFLFMANTAWAGLITLDTASNANDFSVDFFNDNFLTLGNVINGGLSTENLAPGAVTSQDIATTANPLNREFYNIGEYVYSGGTIATSATLASTITAMVAFIANDGDNTLHLVNTAATAKTFTASRDTYVYCDFTGAFSYTAVLNGAAQPATPTNSIIIAKVVTSAGAITSVTDMRQTTPTNLRVYLDYKNGCVISRDIATATKVTIGRGDVEFGSTGKVRRNTGAATIDFTTNGRNGLDTGSVLKDAYYYIFAVPDDDTSTAFDGIASLSSSDAAGVTDERLVGWAYASGTAAISPDSIGAYRERGGDAPNIAQTINKGLSIAVTTTTTPLTTLKFYSSGRPVKITYGATAHKGASGTFILSLSPDSAVVLESEIIAYAITTTSLGGSANGVLLRQMGAGEHTFTLNGLSQAGETTTFAKCYITAEEM